MNLLATVNHAWHYFKSDARHFQIAYLGFFLSYGLIALGWDVEWYRYAITVVACLVAQLAAILLITKDHTSLKSALITSLSLSLLFKAVAIPVIILAAVLSIASKFLIRFNGKHVFNPANFGIMMTILLTGQAWVSPGQWGSDAILLILVGVASLMVLLKVGRLDVGLAFITTYLGLQFIRVVVYQGWGMDVFLHQFTSGTLLLFAFFMITDPISTPGARGPRIFWAIAIGALSFVFVSKFYLYSAPLWALFFLSPFTALLDRTFIHSKFNWRTIS